jgi:hypothetical protein
MTMAAPWAAIFFLRHFSALMLPPADIHTVVKFLAGG